MALVAIVATPVTANAETGGYPYAGYYGPGTNPAGSFWADGSGNGVSPNGYYYRNCTDYVAWKLKSLGVPDSKVRGLGNGGEWAVRATGRAGVTVNNTPAYGAAAVRPKSSGDPYGHVAFVEEVFSDGRIRVSEYNWVVGGVPDGSYHTRTQTPASMGLTQFVHFGLTSSVNPSNSGNRIAVIDSGQVVVKAGPLNATWSLVGGGSVVKMSPNRIATYSNGALYVKEGALNAPWVQVTGNVDAFEVTDNRIGILVGGVLSVKEGPLNATWNVVGGGSSFKMSPNRIALYDHGNQLVIKQGPLNATWHAVTGNINAFEVTDNRIGIMVGGQLSVKEGPLNAVWSHVGGGSSFEMS